MRHEEERKKFLDPRNESPSSVLLFFLPFPPILSLVVTSFEAELCWVAAKSQLMRRQKRGEERERWKERKRFGGHQKTCFSNGRRQRNEQRVSERRRVAGRNEIERKFHSHSIIAFLSFPASSRLLLLDVIFHFCTDVLLLPVLFMPGVRNAADQEYVSTCEIRKSQHGLSLGKGWVDSIPVMIRMRATASRHNKDLGLEANSFPWLPFHAFSSLSLFSSSSSNPVSNCFMLSDLLMLQSFLPDVRCWNCQKHLASFPILMHIPLFCELLIIVDSYCRPFPSTSYRLYIFRTFFVLSLTWRRERVCSCSSFVAAHAFIAPEKSIHELAAAY